MREVKEKFLEWLEKQATESSLTYDIIRERENRE